MFKKIAYYLVSLLLVICVSGCSLFVPHKQSITISGDPANANVVVNGRHMTTPTTLQLPRNKHVNIVVSKAGYSTFTMHSGYSIGPWGVLDIIGGVCFLVPFFGLLSPGAYELEQENFYYVLTPEKR